MGGNIRVARIAGIPVELNISWFFIFFLVAWSLAMQVFPVWQPGLGGGAYWLFGLVTAFVLFGSLLLHELAHSLMSRRYGLEVRRITLFLFGGVSESPAEMPSPKAEFWIAIVGPLSSLLLGGLFFGVGAGAAALEAPAALVAALHWLGVLNVALAVFNLIPGYPLDGGRVLRAAIWARTQDMRKATRWASYGGRAFAAVLIGIGVARVFGGNWFGGLWLFFLGWLLFQAAQGSYSQLVLKEQLNQVRVGAIMTRSVLPLAPAMRLREAVEQYFMRHPYGGYPVIDGDVLVGFITRQQVQAVPPEQWDALEVGALMTPVAALPIIEPEAPVGEVLERMGAEGHARLPVVAHGELVGVLSQSDIMRYLSWHETGRKRRFWG